MSSIAGLTDRGTVAAYLIVNTTRLSGPNYTTSRDVTIAASGDVLRDRCVARAASIWVTQPKGLACASVLAKKSQRV